LMKSLKGGEMHKEKDDERVTVGDITR
jgi:hypothetical protein